MDRGIKYLTCMPCSSGTSADSVQWKHSVSQERIDYCCRRQMPLPVNNVEGEQQLNDQTHYSSQQIKATGGFWCRIYNVCACLWGGGCMCRHLPVSLFVRVCICVCVSVWELPESSSSVPASLTNRNTNPTIIPPFLSHSTWGFHSSLIKTRSFLQMCLLRSPICSHSEWTVKSSQLNWSHDMMETTHMIQSLIIC